MRVEEFIQKFYGVKASLGSRFLVAHKMPSWEPGIDYASEVFGEGAKLGLQPKASHFRAGRRSVSLGLKLRPKLERSGNVHRCFKVPWLLRLRYYLCN